MGGKGKGKGKVGRGGPTIFFPNGGRGQGLSSGPRLTGLCCYLGFARVLGWSGPWCFVALMVTLLWCAGTEPAWSQRQVRHVVTGVVSRPNGTADAICAD